MHSVAFDICQFSNALEEIIVIYPAHATRHYAEVRERVAQNKADHCVVLSSTLEMLHQKAIALRSVKVVRVDHRKGLVDRFVDHQNSVQRAPWFGAAGRDGKSLRKFIEFLKDIFDRDVSLKPCTY